MNIARAILAGAVGGVAMTVLGWIVRQFGLEMNAEMRFERVTHRAGATVGLGFAVIHVIIAGFVMAMIPALLYGAVVAALYRPVAEGRSMRAVPA